MTDTEPTFTPFADDATVRSIGSLSFENGTRRIAVHGNLDLPRDRAGLERAHALKRTVDAIVGTLEGERLPDTVSEAVEPGPGRVPNPFA